MDSVIAVNGQQTSTRPARPAKTSQTLDSISLPDERAQLPERFKVRRMWELERSHGGRDIRLIITDLYGVYKNWSTVAAKLGLKRPTLRLWREQLGIRVHIDVRLQ